MLPLFICNLQQEPNGFEIPFLATPKSGHSPKVAAAAQQQQQRQCEERGGARGEKEGQRKRKRRKRKFLDVEKELKSGLMKTGLRDKDVSTRRPDFTKQVS